MFAEEELVAGWKSTKGRNQNTSPLRYLVHSSIGIGRQPFKREAMIHIFFFKNSTRWPGAFAEELVFNDHRSRSSVKMKGGALFTETEDDNDILNIHQN